MVGLFLELQPRLSSEAWIQDLQRGDYSPDALKAMQGGVGVGLKPLPDLLLDPLRTALPSGVSCIPAG